MITEIYLNGQHLYTAKEANKDVLFQDCYIEKSGVPSIDLFSTHDFEDFHVEESDTKIYISTR